ncbi:hypothetical protein QCN29_17750 [Streptomyces sp. HNM0663]|uniref:Transcriptional regulator n=1 Tax=Streptomyces chengmaiensis TaxID=3040919 RepID=A0ABT6HQN3_9ACTN|nr:hypothetical protein [Streptomyces chengmaiensis]MDH2390602.1 hypothetical protein [Streptomyces chengmaiensis]
MNALGAEMGLPLHYQRPSVAQWLVGTQPRPPVPHLIAEAFSRRLGRVVTIEEAGFRDLPRSRSPGPQDDLVGGLVVLGDPVRAEPHEAHPGRVYSISLLEHIGKDSPGITQRPRQKPTGRRIGRAEVLSGRAMLDLFSTADQIFGGGHVRRAMSSYLSTTVAPWLEAPSGATVNQHVLSLAARLCYLCAFAHFDDQQHGTAQRYYASGLRLARCADDLEATALNLRGLSVQAHTLGHRRQALILAEAALEGGRAGTPPRLKAALLGQQAVTEAAMGEKRLAMAHLLDAERQLDKDPDASAAIGVYHASSLLHQRAEAATLLGDGSAADAAFDQALRNRSAMERRSRLLILHKHAELQLSRGYLEAACGTWHRFLEEYPHVRSKRADDACLAMRACLHPHRNNPLAASLLRKSGDSR